MDRDQNTEGRRAVSRATKLRRRKTRMNFIILAVFAALIAIMILVTPKEPQRRATYSVGTESGLVGESEGEVIGAYDGLIISEIMSSNATAVNDEKGKYPRRAYEPQGRRPVRPGRPDQVPVPQYQPGGGRPGSSILRQHKPGRCQQTPARQVQAQQRKGDSIPV